MLKDWMDKCQENSKDQEEPTESDMGSSENSKMQNLKISSHIALTSAPSTKKVLPKKVKSRLKTCTRS